MQKTLIAATVGLLALGAAAYAQAPQPAAPGDPSRAERMQERMERRAGRMDERINRRIERLKADLKLTPAQEPLWASVESQFRKSQAERRSYRQANAAAFRNAELPERMDMIAQRQSVLASQTREMSAAIRPLWATLDASQKETVRKMLPGGRMGERRGESGEGRGERRG